MGATHVTAHTDGQETRPANGTLHVQRPAYGMASTQTYEPGLEPTLESDAGWLYTLPARTDAATLPKRRIERIWTVDGRPCLHTRGDTLTIEAEFVGQLGAAANDNTQWQLIWQAHGPGGSDLTNWRPPPVSLGVYDGRIWFEGGEGHPDHQPNPGGYYKWRHDLGPWVDGQRHHIRIEVLLGNDPDGLVSCVFDGTTICDGWRPEGFWPWDGGIWTGRYPGTIYSHPEHHSGDWVANRSGLYRGPKGGATNPTYAQWVKWWPVEVARAHQPTQA